MSNFVPHDERFCYQVDREELMNQIYDTLMGNVGMTEHHTPLPDFDYHYVDLAHTPYIHIEIGKKAYKLVLYDDELEEEVE